jgi:excisionase family DNA binding protein
MFSIEVTFKVKDRQVSGEQFTEALVKELAQSLKTHLQPIQIPRAQTFEAVPKAPPPGTHDSRHEPRLFSVHDAARILGLKASTIRKYIHLRRITVVRLGGRVMIPAAVIDQIVNEGMPSAR